MSEVASHSFFIDCVNRRLLSAPSSIQQAAEPKFFKGDISTVNVRAFSPAEITINPSSTLRIGIGVPGETPLATAILSESLDGGKGRTGTLNLSNAAVLAALGTSAKDFLRLQFEVELIDEDAEPKTLVRTPCSLYNVVLNGDAPADEELPTYPPAAALALKTELLSLATKADLDALRGGVPLTGWANSTAYPFGTCTITGGIPSALEFAGSTDDFAYAELALTDFAPDTLDISGTVSAGTVELADLSLVFLDGAGAEAGTIGALTLGAAFSFASVVVPYGAVKVAVKALGTAATSSLSTGFTALSVTAHATLSELTADALDAILADKAQAEAGAGTIADLVTPAQTNAQTIADLVAPAQADAAAAEASAATAAAAVASMTVAPLNSIATSSQVVRGSDLRLGLRGGVWTTVNSASVSGGLRPVTPVAGWACLSLNWLSRNHVAQTTVQSFTGAEFIAGVQFGFYVQMATTGVPGMYYNAGAGHVYTGAHTPPAGWQWLHLIWDASARTFSFFYDGATVAAATVTIPGTLPCGPLLNVMAGWTASGSAYAALGHVRSALVLNFIPSDAQRLALMRGEYPQAWLGGSPKLVQDSTVWTDVGGAYVASGGTITTNTGGVLAVSSPNALAANNLWLNLGVDAPILRLGQTVRVRYSLTVNSGETPRATPTSANASTGVLATSGATMTAGASSVQDIVVTAQTGIRGLGLMLTTTGAHDFTLSNVSIEILGAQILVGPNDWSRTRGVDMSGNCNDLIYSTGVVAVEPATKARVIAATAAGATITAGGVGGIGTITGVSYSDTKAIAAMRAWDSAQVTAAQSIPFQATGLFATVTANGTVSVRTGALGTNPTFSAGFPLKLVHNI